MTFPTKSRTQSANQLQPSGPAANNNDLSLASQSSVPWKNPKSAFLVGLLGTNETCFDWRGRNGEHH